MKSGLVFVLLFVTNTSFAGGEKSSKLVPELCSPVNSKTDVVSVCLGVLSGTNQQAITLYLNDQTTRTYKVQIEDTPPKMGVSVARFQGSIMYLKILDSISGEVSTTSGITVSHGIILETANSNLKFRGPLWPVGISK